MSDVTLTVQGLTKTIGGKPLIKGVDFELRRGEVFGFLGPNGAGKTTTIRMIVGLMKPTSGTIRICGYDIATHYSEAMDRLGCIVENPEAYSYLSGWANLQLHARMMKGVGEGRIAEVTEKVGLSARIHDKVKTYSLGMRQRLGIAQAMLGRPQVLILDEPTNGLDPSGIREMREFVRQLAEKDGVSVLVSSHLLGEIQQMCDRVAIMTAGEVVRVGTVYGLLASRERLSWLLEPLELGAEVLRRLDVPITRENDRIITPYEEQAAGAWNRALVEAGVTVGEMRRLLPSLEDLFMELTGGRAIE